MKTLSKGDIEHRFKSSNIKPSVRIETLKNPLKSRDLSLEKKWSITIPGLPFTDSRPRFNTEISITYNPNKNNMDRVIKRLYELADVREDVCILSPCIVHIRAYFYFPPEEYKIMDKKYIDKVKNMVSKENLHSVYLKDVDNINKIHYDVFQDSKIRVILNDAFIVKADTEKIAIDNPNNERVEMDIYYTEKGYWCSNKVKRSREYFYYKLSMKYKILNNIPDKIWQKEFMKTIVEFIKICKLKKNSAVMKSFNKTLSLYTSEDLNLLLPGNQSKEKKIDILLKQIEKIFDILKK